MPAGYVHVWYNGRNQITRAVILFAADIPVRQVPSIALEEMVQATGLLTDIESDWYSTRTIFAETSGNTLTRLQPQDIMALRRHYAR